MAAGFDDQTAFRLESRFDEVLIRIPCGEGALLELGAVAAGLELYNFGGREGARVISGAAGAWKEGLGPHSPSGVTPAAVNNWLILLLTEAG